MTEEAQAVIDRYELAFKTANDRSLESTIRYERGWFVFRGQSGLVQSRHRRADINTMIDRLQARAVQKPS